MSSPARPFGPYVLQAAIAAVHADARAAGETDWAEVVGLYDVLVRVEPSPVVRLNRAVAVAMRDGPGAGLALVDAIAATGELADYRLLHAARADLLRRLERWEEARAAYTRALALTQQVPEQLAGFHLLDAENLDQALALAAKIPPEREGSVEVRPVRQLQP